jgi:hypothetical protein
LRLSAIISQYFIRVQVDHELPPVAQKCSGHVMGVYIKTDRADEFLKRFSRAREHKPSRQRFRNKSSRARERGRKMIVCRRSAREAGHLPPDAPDGTSLCHLRIME